jgi:hypothetical protein
MEEGEGVKRAVALMIDDGTFRFNVGIITVILDGGVILEG